jgi:hypothetical protein
MQLTLTYQEALNLIAREHCVRPKDVSIIGLGSDDIIQALKYDHKLNAIKIAREKYGMGLKEAKEFVEKIGTTDPNILVVVTNT